MPREPSQRDLEILSAIQAGETHASIGRRFNLSRERIGQIAAANGMRGRRTTISDEEIEGYVAQYRRGVPFAHMSCERSGSSISAALDRRGIHRRKGLRAPEWSASDTDILRGLWGKLSCAEIAKVVGTTKNAVIGRAHRLGIPKVKNASRELVDA